MVDRKLLKNPNGLILGTPGLSLIHISYDELELDTLGDRKTALFLIRSDTEDSMNFLIAMAYSQLFNLLCEKADACQHNVTGLEGKKLAHISDQRNDFMDHVRSRTLLALLAVYAQAQSCILRIAGKPVSYTHLDVYTRQT